VTLCRKKPLSVRLGIGAKEHDEEGRVVCGGAPLSRCAAAAVPPPPHAERAMFVPFSNS
jgi:hypothetical protein